MTHLEYISTIYNTCKMHNIDVLKYDYILNESKFYYLILT